MEYGVSKSDIARSSVGEKTLFTGTTVAVIGIEREINNLPDANQPYFRNGLQLVSDLPLETTSSVGPMTHHTAQLRHLTQALSDILCSVRPSDAVQAAYPTGQRMQQHAWNTAVNLFATTLPA